MTLNELRIENLVYLFGDAIKLTKDHLIYLFEKDGIPEPITLTPEWLLNLGFKNEKEGIFAIPHIDYSYVIESKRNYKFNDDGYFMGIRFDDWDADPVSINKFAYDNIYYVHQLQNLYFALTGRELKFAPSN